MSSKKMKKNLKFQMIVVNSPVDAQAVKGENNKKILQIYKVELTED